MLDKATDIFLSQGGLKDLKTLNKVLKPARSFPASEEDIVQHTEFVKKIKNNLWGINEEN